MYQMTLGSYLHLRRIDSDYVNISHLQDFLGVDLSAGELPNAVVISQGSSFVCGTWVPAAAARQLIVDQPLVNAFLSDDLESRFPPTLDAFTRSKSQSHSLVHPFGRPFQSTTESKRESLSSFRLELPSRDPDAPWEAGTDSPWDVEDHLLSVHPPFALASAVRVPPVILPTEDTEPETPLSPSEEEMFRTLCSVPDWEPESVKLVDVDEPLPVTTLEQEEAAVTEDSRESVRERPLRRSKRVSTAVATRPTTRSRTRSNKRGSRSSLS